MPYAVKVIPGQKVDLNDYDPDEDGGLDKEEGVALADTLGQQLDELQELLYAAGTHAVLVVLQGMDAAGKDGTIRHVFKYVDPLGCHVWPFKVPTSEEAAHDFLWRVHNKTPEKAYIGVFNRSHYEDVLVVRVDKLAPKSVWEKRYDHINNFERNLADSNTLIVKFFLNVSQKEQMERLTDREKDTEKAYKLSADDWRKRSEWDDYIAAYEEALTRCSTEYAPWYIVPSDRKWFRNLAITQTLVDILLPHKQEWLKTLEERGKEELSAIADLQKSKKAR